MSQKMSDRQRLLRPVPAQKSNSRKRSMLKLLRWGWIAGATSVISLVVSVMPALAEELSDWSYDTETRSLNITLPATTKPILSVTADDQLRVELPNTQVGRAIGQTVFDGVVESIVLEQATPETVWMVVDFAPGTILASAQSATSIVSSSSDSNGMRQWQVRPELMATRRVAGAIASLSTEPSTSADAAALRTEPSVSTQAAQVADFPDLPILEPAIPIDAPIVVPPITARAPEPIQPAPLPPVAIRQPSEPTPVSIPAAIEADAVEDEAVIAILKPELPVVTPIDGTPLAEIETPEAETVEAEIVETPTVEEAAVEEAVIEEAVIEEAVAVVEVVAAPTITSPVALGTTPPPTESQNEPPSVVIPEIDLSDNSSARTINSRWPEPIPFGQPLP